MNAATPDETPIGPSAHLDPAAMAAKKNQCFHLYTMEDLYLSGHWGNVPVCVDIHAGSGPRVRQTITLSPDEACQLAEDLIEMANAVDATREILAAQGSEKA